MQLGILQCDSVRPELQPEFGNYPDMFQRLLTTERVQPEYRIYDLSQDQFPRSPDECDAWLITGSKRSVYEPEPWIERAHQLVRELDAERRPLVGICFGHQMIARALGGAVEKASAGWGVGVHTSRIIEPRPWMQPGRERLSLLVSHQDQVIEPPARACHLAGHDFCPYDMFQIDDHILTFQGHPEFCHGYSRAMIELRREQIGADTARAGLDSLAQPADADVAAEWIHRFIERAAAGRAVDADTMRAHDASAEGRA